MSKIFSRRLQRVKRADYGIVFFTKLVFFASYAVKLGGECAWVCAASPELTESRGLFPQLSVQRGQRALGKTGFMRGFPRSRGVKLARLEPLVRVEKLRRLCFERRAVVIPQYFAVPFKSALPFAAGLTQILQFTLRVGCRFQESMGLAAPQITYIMHDLQAKGLPVDTNATTIEEAKRSILRALEKQIL